MMKKLLGLLLTCVVVPGFYAGGMYYLATHHVYEPKRADDAFRLAVLIAVPLVVSGAVKWWDVWVNRAPKLGAYWTPVSPSAYAVRLFRGHGIIALACVIFQLYVEQQEATNPISKLGVKEMRAEWRQVSDRFWELEVAGDKRAGRFEPRMKQLEKDLERGDAEQRRLFERASGPATILMVCAAGTSIYVPRKYRNQSGQPITDDEG